jgi:two-component sensor histidine kinase
LALAVGVSDRSTTERRTRFVERVRPYSWTALGLVVICLAVATLLRMIVFALGINALFPTFYPAVLFAALIAGTPAGIATIVGSILIAWWAFIPPAYEFGALTGDEAGNLVLFAASSGCLVFMSHLYRGVLVRLRRRDRERELLLREMQHRGRNTYAVVESIVRNTLINDRDSANAIAGRVRAVSSANDLVNQSDEKTVPLQALLSLEFAPNPETRLRTSGPYIEVSSDAARKLGLVFHELVTNAMKHGALSRPNGRIDVDWQTDGRMVRLVWREHSGPAVSPPTRQGFGTVIVTESLKSLSGSTTFTFHPAGLRCDMHFSSQ